MPDHLDLLERFEPLATASFASVTEPGVLRARVAQRRRRHRLVVGGAAAVLVLVAAVAVAALGSDPAPVDDLRTVSPTDPDGAVAPTIPASYGSEPRLVVGVVPPDMWSAGCNREQLEAPATVCTLTIPATRVPDGVTLFMRAAEPEVTAAWEAGDADAARDALQQIASEAEFVEIGGRTVLSVGVVNVVDGASVGEAEDRVTRSYEVLIGTQVIQVNAEDLTGDQLAAVIGGLSTEPVDLGFAIPVSALPEGAEVIAQGQQRLWFEPDRLDPSRSIENGGDAAGITYALPEKRTGLDVVVVRDVDAPAYVATWASQQAALDPASDLPIEDIAPNGRDGKRVRLRSGGAPNGAITGQRLAVAADDRTVVLVYGPAAQEAELFAIAGSTTVHDRPAAQPTTTSAGTEPATTTATTAASTTPTVPGDPAATGWFVPDGLPANWSLRKAVVQGVDGSGQAQLWLDSPAGNLMIVTLQVPSDGSWHTDGAVTYPLLGYGPPVFAEPASDVRLGNRVTQRDGATISVDWLAEQTNDTERTAAEQEVGYQELDELLRSLVPATSSEWRRYLEPVDPPAPLVDAATLEALPDET